MPMRRPSRERTPDVGPSSSFCAQWCADLRAHRRGQPARQGDGDADHVLGNRPGPDAARAGHDHRAGEQLGEHQAADADRRTLHPAQARGRRENVAIDERRERDVGVRQQPAERVAIPGLEKRVLRKVAAELIDEVTRQDPDRPPG